MAGWFDKFVGKVVLATGGSRGIGRAIALALAERGARVAFRYRAAAAEAVVQAARGRGWPVAARQADVGVSEPAARLAADLLAQGGRLDVLVNNAGPFRGDLLWWWAISRRSRCVCCAMRRSAVSGRRRRQRRRSSS